MRRVVAFAGLLLPLAYLLPNHYPPWATFHADLVTGIAFAPLLIWAIFRQGSVPLIAVGAGMLAMVPLVQIAFGQIIFAGDGWVASLYVMGFALAVLSGFRLMQATHGGIASAFPIFVGLFFSALLSVGVAIHQWLDLGIFGLFIVEMKPGDRVYANLSQPNQFATLLMLGLASVAFLYESRMLRASIGVVSASILSFGLAMTQSRTPVLALCLIIPFYFAIRKKAQLRISGLALACVVGVFFVAAIWWSEINNWLLLSSVSSLNDRTTESARFILWHSTVDALLRSPWVGYGWNQAGLAQQVVALDYPALRVFFDSSHNLFLDLALWNGIPLAIVISILLIVWLFDQVRGCCNPLVWSVLIAVIAVSSHALVEYPLSYAYFLIPMGFMVGVLSQANESGSFLKMRVQMPRGVVLGIGLMACAIFLLVASEYARFEDKWRQIRYEQARVGTTESKVNLNMIVLTQLREYAHLARTKPTPGMSSEDLNWMRQVSERYPWAAPTYKYAHAMALNGYPEAASAALAKLCKIQSRALCQKAIDEWRDLEKQSPVFQMVEIPDLTFNKK